MRRMFVIAIVPVIVIGSRLVMFRVNGITVLVRLKHHVDVRVEKKNENTPTAPPRHRSAAKSLCVFSFSRRIGSSDPRSSSRVASSAQASFPNPGKRGDVAGKRTRENRSASH